MQSTRVLLALPVLLLGVASSPRPAQEEAPRPLRPILFQEGAVAEERSDEVRAALMSLAQYVRAQHGRLLRPSIYQTVLFEGLQPFYHFNEFAESARMEEVFAGFRGDPEWQRRATAYFASIDVDLTNEILLPVAGRAGEPGDTRTWRRARVIQGHHASALRAGRELTDHVNSAHPEVSMRFYAQEMEQLGILHWIADYPELETWAEVRGQLLQDETYQALLDELATHLVEGSVRTQMLDRLQY